MVIAEYTPSNTRVELLISEWILPTALYNYFPLNLWEAAVENWRGTSTRIRMCRNMISICLPLWQSISMFDTIFYKNTTCIVILLDI